MRIRFLASSTVVVEHEGFKILCDPWLTDGIYYGSWYHYPPLTIRPEDLSDVDALYISHIHPDHLDRVTLSRLPKNIPVFILEFEEKYVARTLRALGFHDVREVPHGTETELAAGFHVAIFAADDCDPEVCGRFLGCSLPTPYRRTLQIDSLAVFRAGSEVVVNTNDSPYVIARPVCDRVLSTYGHVDLLMCGYSGAGPYPQCFDSLDPQARSVRAATKRAQFLDMFAAYVRHLKPRYVMPFAGQYTFGGRLTALNPLRGMTNPEELATVVPPIVDAASAQTRAVLLNEGAWIDVRTGAVSAPYSPPDPERRESYVREVLASKIFSYEGDEAIPREKWRDLTQVLEVARGRAARAQERYGVATPWSIYLDTGQDELYRVDFQGRPVDKVARGSEVEPFLRIAVDYTLLTMILDRKAHWNNAEIGGHLRYFRSPDVYDRGLHQILAYFHT